MDELNETLNDNYQSVVYGIVMYLIKVKDEITDILSKIDIEDYNEETILLLKQSIHEIGRYIDFINIDEKEKELDILLKMKNIIDNEINKIDIKKGIDVED